MAVVIPEDKIIEVKNAADILEVISETVVLKKSGSNYFGLCPFHSEKTPSFSVNPGKQIFHCFGCGNGGDVFQFVVQQQGVSFPEAVRMLGRRYGIDLPQRPMTSGQKQQASIKSKILEANREAMTFFQHCLHSRQNGSNARRYLEKRGFALDRLERFSIGYAPAGWDHLLAHFRKKRIDPKIAETAGLIVRKKNGGYYDRFRDRIQFPIFDTANRVIAFGGRVLGDDLPKYLNSPESMVYQKSRSLYGLNWAKHRCREAGAVFIVEGYLDLLSLHLHGIENVVATLGTALTPEHLRLLKGFVGDGRITLVFDGDAAGIKAAQRSIDLFLENHTDFRKGDVYQESNADTRILVLPDGHDPDTFVNTYGAEAFHQRAEEALGVVGFLLSAAVDRFGASTQGKISVLKEMAGVLAGINDPVARSLYVREVAEQLQVPERTVLDMIREYTNISSKRRADAAHRSPEQGVDLEDGRAAEGPGSRIERQIVAMMLSVPDVIPEVVSRRILNRFTDMTLRSIGECIVDHRECLQEGVTRLMDEVSDDRQRNLLSMLAIVDQQWDEDGCRRLLKQFENSRERQDTELISAIKEAEAKQDHDTLIKLLRQKQDQARKRHSTH